MVFSNAEIRQILVSFDGHELDVYLDNPTRQLSFVMAPDVLFFWLLVPVSTSQIELNSLSVPVFRGLYLTLVFLPLGWLLAGLFFHPRARHPWPVILTAAGISLGAVAVPWVMRNPTGLSEYPVWQSLAGVFLASAAVWFSRPEERDELV